MHAHLYRKTLIGPFEHIGLSSIYRHDVNRPEVCTPAFTCVCVCVCVCALVCVCVRVFV